MVSLVLALFAIVFGTRSLDVTEHHRGMVLAIAPVCVELRTIHTHVRLAQDPPVRQVPATPRLIIRLS